MNDDTQLRQLLASWCQAFQSCDPSAMKELWDHSGDLIYQSEEMDHVLLTWDAVDEYWDKIPGLIDAIPEWLPTETHYLRHGDSATIYAKLHTNIVLAGSRKPLIGDLRVTLGARRIGEAWKLVSIHESRQLDLAPYL
jgi:hypothetical protein